MSRTRKTSINSIVGLGGSIANSLLSFVLQAVFIRLLGLEYSGINSLFTSILNILNIAELGVSNAVLFRLYSSIAKGEKKATEVLLAEYKRICYLIGGIILLGGLVCVPFLDNLVNGGVPDFPESLTILFGIVLMTSVCNQFLDYKKILLIAYQDRFIVTITTYSCTFICHALQIFTLFFFKNIYVYLLCKLFTTCANGLICGWISKKKYQIQWNEKDTLSQQERIDIVKDSGTLAVYKICRTVDASIDTFLISKFVDISTTAIYGSMSMILSSITDLLGQFNDGMIASVGDLYASGDKERVESVFYQSFHFTFILHGICVAVLVPLMGPFVDWWIGYTLPDVVIYMMLANFYMHGLAANASTFRNSMGLFRKGWKQPAATVLLNAFFSILFVKKIGLLGTLLGTFFARILTQTWYEPYIICKHGYDKKPYKYYLRYIAYSVMVVGVSMANAAIASLLPTPDNLVSLVWHGVIYLVVSAGGLVLLGFFFKEQKAVINRVIQMVKGRKM